MMTSDTEEIKVLLNSLIGVRIINTFISIVDECIDPSVWEVRVIKLNFENGLVLSISYRTVERDQETLWIEVEEESGRILYNNILPGNNIIGLSMESFRIIENSIIYIKNKKIKKSIKYIFGIIIFFNEKSSINIYKLTSGHVENSFEPDDLIYKNIMFVDSDSICVISNPDIIDSLKLNEYKEYIGYEF